MKRKGISPIISAVLLVAVTVSVVAVFSGWAPSLAQSVTDQTTNSTLQKLECEDASAEIESAYYDGENLTASVLNTGNQELPGLIIAAFDENEQLMDQTDMNLGSGINDTTIENLNSKPSYVQAYSSNCDNVRHTFEDINQ